MPGASPQRSSCPGSRIPASNFTISRAEWMSTFENGSSSSRIFRIIQQRPRQRHSLPHALRILSNRPLQCRIQADRCNRRGTTRIVLDAVEPREVAQILHAAHLVVEQRRMRHVPKFAAHFAGIFVTENGDLASAWAAPVPRVSAAAWSCPHRCRRGWRTAAWRSNDAVTPRKAAKRPNCFTRFVTVMIGSACARAVLGSFTVEWNFVREAAWLQRHTPCFVELLPLGHALRLFGLRRSRLPDHPAWRGAYFDAHFACSALAWNTPSLPKLPSASACELSLNVSGGGSVPA